MFRFKHDETLDNLVRAVLRDGDSGELRDCTELSLFYDGFDQPECSEMEQLVDMYVRAKGRAIYNVTIYDGCTRMYFFFSPISAARKSVQEILDVIEEDLACVPDKPCIPRRIASCSKPNKVLQSIR
jgi:hypothetical protein